MFGNRKKKKNKEMMVKTKTEQTKSHPSYHHLTIVPLHRMQLVSIWDFHLCSKLKIYIYKT